MWLINFNKKQPNITFEPLENFSSDAQSINSYNKSYSSEAERAFRYSVFIKNVANFEEEELKHPEVDLDVTKFADWTDEEMARILCGNRREMQVHDSRQRFENAAEGGRRPDEVNWVQAGKVSAVKDQGQCGSCWAFATVASVESAYVIAHDQLVELSEQELVDCDTRNNGCSGGYRPYAMRDHLRCRHPREVDRDVVFEAVGENLSLTIEELLDDCDCDCGHAAITKILKAAVSSA